jgi:ribonuclease VapC
MILDSSALVSVICCEPEHEELLRKIAQARVLAIGAPTVAETQLLVSIKLGRDAADLVDQLLAELQVTVIAFGREHLAVFAEASQRFGQGRHPAQLNMGDCFTYATAKVAGLPLLFIGDDFRRTDILAA